MPPPGNRRSRGLIDTLPSGSLRVKVYAGIDPVTKKRLYLDETVPAGPKAAKEAEKIRTRLLAQLDERRNPRTRATVRQIDAILSSACARLGGDQRQQPQPGWLGQRLGSPCRPGPPTGAPATAVRRWEAAGKVGGRRPS
jgi:hypothetical protein